MAIPLKMLRLCVVALLAATFCVSTAFTQKWVSLAPFPEPAEEVYGIASGGKLYVFGGLGPGWKPLGMVYEYDPATNAWTKKKPMILPSHHVALAEANGKIYVIGGFVLPQSGPPSWVPLDNAWEYDPRADTWKALAPMPTKRGSPSAVSAGGKIYVIGGASTHPGSKEVGVHPARPHRSLDTNEVYDPATNRWETRSPMPTARNHAAVGVVNNRIYVIGGRIGAAFMVVPATAVDVVEEYRSGNQPVGRAEAVDADGAERSVVGYAKGKVYVVGGEMRSNNLWGVFRAVEAYDPATNNWTVLEPLPIPRHGHAGDVIGNRLHVVSGDVMSLGGAKPQGVQIETDLHDALELPDK